MKKADLLKAALRVVESRGLNYGTPENNFARIAALWTIYFDQRERKVIPTDTPTVDETDVAALMVLMKVARLMEKPDHLDSWMDIAGYAACGAEVSRAGEGGGKGEPLMTASEVLNDALDKWAAQETVFRDVAEAAMGDAVFTGTGTLKVSATNERGDLVVEHHPVPTVRIRGFEVGDKVVSRWGHSASVGEVTAVNGTLLHVSWSRLGVDPWVSIVGKGDVEHAALPTGHEAFNPGEDTPPGAHVVFINPTGKGGAS